MNQPFIAIILVFVFATQFSEVKAQRATAGTGDLGSTTTEGNTYWVAAQLALQRGEGEAAFTSSDRACQEGTAIACTVAGEMIVQGQTKMGTPEQSVALFQKGCDLGNANACQGLGLMLVQGIGVAADAKKGQNVMQKACQASNAMACVNLGLMYRMGLFGPPNPKEANLYLNRALALQPDNELALQAIKEIGQAPQVRPPAGSPQKPSAPTVSTTELRGRLASNPAPAMTAASGPQAAPNTCWDYVTTQWNTAREFTPSKPTWNPPASVQAVTLGDAQTIGLLMLMASRSGATLPAGIQSLADCQSHYETALRAFLRQQWTIAPNALAQNTVMQVNPSIELAGQTANGEQTLLLMIDIGGSSPRPPPYADKTFAMFRVNCDAGEVTPQFFFQTDRQGKLQPATTSSIAAPPATVSERARRLGCAPQSERRLWTQLSGLEAALSLRFEQDQQQTP
ncbi:MAG TPA: hypothetical protein DIU09_05400 [Hyphomonadaceae bacterium]|nr:hypothetical protein [Hyphomonadaceae bacterium]